MPRKGLNKDAVVDAAVALIADEGQAAFSVNELARRLDIRPASLYNHIRSLDELTDEIGSRIAERLRRAESEATRGKTREEAVLALCSAYRSFALENAELYRVNMGRQLVGHDFEKAEKGEIVDPMMKTLSEFALDEHQKMHWHRILRALLHGYVSQELAGRFRGFPVESEQTFRKSVHAIILGITADEKRMNDEQV